MTIREILPLYYEYPFLFENDILNVKFKDQIVYASVWASNHQFDVQLSTEYYHFDLKSENITKEEVLDLIIEERWTIKEVFFRI